MLCKVTPFQATTKNEFEDNIEAGIYSLKKAAISDMTLECVMFLCEVLQFDEHARSGVDDLIKHDYII